MPGILPRSMIISIPALPFPSASVTSDHPPRTNPFVPSALPALPPLELSIVAAILGGTRRRLQRDANPVGLLALIRVLEALDTKEPL